MKVNVTTNKQIFTKLNVPQFDTRLSNCSIRSCSLPLHLSLNKTYYYCEGKKMRAFRILAISFQISRTSNRSFGKRYFLIQFPNEQPTWIQEFTTNKCIFENTEDVFAHTMGQSVNINKYEIQNQVSIEDICKSVNSNTDYCFNSWGDLETNWLWDESEQNAKAYSTNIQHILYVNDTIHICVEQKGYLTKEECIKNHFDGLVIEDFAVEPFEIKIQIQPNKKKIHTLRFIELE